MSRKDTVLMLLEMLEKVTAALRRMAEVGRGRADCSVQDSTYAGLARDLAAESSEMIDHYRRQDDYRREGAA